MRCLERIRRSLLIETAAMSLLSQEASVILAGAIHLCNRKKGSVATRELLAEFLETLPDNLPLARTESLPAPVFIQEDDDSILVKVASVSSQPVYRGRWADLNSDDSDG